ncbi:MAG: ABC transporter substrate-binding protein [Chloroflexi bacterium]|nr:ABC transporter substrate-binding protein [Chloroflexota bacterium]
MRKALRFFACSLLLVVLAACGVSSPAPTGAPPPATGAPPAASNAPTPTLPSPSPTAAQSAETGLRIAATADAPTLHPFKRTDTASDAYIALLFTRSLWRYNPQTLEPEPWAAASWTISDDKKTYTFKLQEMQWSDGQPVTAYDWQWTYGQAIKPENNWPYRSYAETNIASYQALDDQTLEITIKDAEPLPVALARIDILPAVLPKHVWGKYDWNDPTKNPEITHPSVVNGPYLLKEWKRDDHATFVRNNLYFKGPPSIATITYRIVPNTSVSLQMLLTGEVDSGTVSATDFDQAKASDKLNLYQWDPAAAAWDYVGFNLRRAPENDVEFRHALSYATPRDLIVQKVYNNLSKPTYSTFPPTSWVYNPDVPKYDYDMATAKATLDRAGYSLDENGNRLGKDGKPIKLKLLYQASMPANEKIALVLQDQFKRLGIDVEIVPLEVSAFLQSVKKEPYDWDLDILAWSVGVEPSDSRLIWSEASIPNLNSVAYGNKQQEDLWDQGEKEYDPARRKVIYQQIQQILSQDSPYIFLAYRTGWSFLNKRVVPNPTTRLGINYDLYKWQIADNPK